MGNGVGVSLSVLMQAGALFTRSRKTAFLGLPTGIKRYTTPTSRGFAFSLFYRYSPCQSLIEGAS